MVTLLCEYSEGSATITVTGEIGEDELLVRSGSTLKFCNSTWEADLSSYAKRVHPIGRTLVVNLMNTGHIENCSIQSADEGGTSTDVIGVELFLEPSETHRQMGHPHPTERESFFRGQFHCSNRDCCLAEILGLVSETTGVGVHEVRIVVRHTT